MQTNNLESKIEALIFASPTPLPASEIHDILGEESPGLKEVHHTILNLMSYYEARQGGFKLVETEGFSFQTQKPVAYLMERMFSQKSRPLSRAAQETLAIIAYRQPVTRADIEFIRGVDAGSIIKHLLERELIACVGRKEIIGRPLIFGTTEEFLRVYQLRTISDLPPLSAFQPSQDVLDLALNKLDLKKEKIDIEAEIRAL